MSFFKISRIKNMAKILGFLLIMFIIAGCNAKKTETVQTSEEIQPEPSAEIAVSQSERQISAVSVEVLNEIIEIKIQGNQKLVYTSIKQSFPFGIAIYLPETRIADDLETNLPENKSINDLIVTYADDEKTTAKVEILLKEDLSYEVIENENMLKVGLFDAIEKILPPGQETVSQEKGLEDDIVISDKMATMTNIEFNTMEDGRSDIFVKTNHPVKYDITQGGPDLLYLNLYNTLLPEYHKRPLLTEYFKSAVESLMPIQQVQGTQKVSRIEIKIREQVPYRIVRNQSIISLYFEPSTVEPPVFGKADKKMVSATGETIYAEPSGAPSETAAKQKTMEEEIFGAPKVYTGEKIKLDFYETDIKNVFRILRSVGGLNFAIDKDVEGKVTLTLQDAVPWDQVLDLVLKMNNLGQKQEGNVIRIATLATIKQEENLKQEAIAARKKSLEQEKSFEPLFTEYIPINYSDAETDILPHLNQILTEGRGKVSVDKRTNMIILTDTQMTIDQAREIIYRLDKVTPQIMIEAKVVEVSKDFSRELGIGWSFTNAPPTTTTDFTVALNHPVTSAISAGSFNFFRVFGSSMTTINAQIIASEEKGDVKIVSSPRILTLDNKSAKIKQGLEYAYLERDDAGGSAVKFKNIDLLLEVTPHVTPDNRIAMTVYLTKNDIDSITNGVPSLSTNEAETELLVNDNDTIVIGGIVKTSDSKGVTGTPILSGIPILGRLFRTETDKDKRNELLIFITPSIVQLEQKKNNYTTTQ